MARLEPMWSGLFGVGLLAATGLYVARGSPSDGGLVLVLAVSLILVTHAHRQDDRLLRLAGVPRRPVHALEYLLAVLPVALVTAFVTGPLPPLMALSAAPAVALLPPGGVARVRARWRDRSGSFAPASSPDLEWRAGSRGLLVPVLLLNGLGVAVSKLPAAPLLLMAITTFLLCGIYRPFEGWPLIEATERSPAAFLRHKLVRGAGYGAVALSPMTAAALIRHPEHAPFVGMVLVGCGVILGGTLLAKYASYSPGAADTGLSELVPAILAASLLLPPIALYLVWRFWRLAIRSLEPHLHAYR